jgi:hypothetical protein
VIASDTNYSFHQELSSRGLKCLPSENISHGTDRVESKWWFHATQPVTRVAENNNVTALNP